ncbi:hypothetical protein [Flagellimonas pacifica]|uniref:Uncharacterized protein n=1 Tax=Flagellimonas pacifica TaxID=1247520 RepID=A0A285MQV3_9FLAO|nr:hypothetical protein [Allomuricauda parva]SNY99550.1 hypothetical protein SAMN06265377_1361 [Allomuricauda parva]
MNATKFKRQAETLMGGLQHLIKNIPQKGNTYAECQLTALLVELKRLNHAVNGVTDEDFIEDNDPKTQ